MPCRRGIQERPSSLMPVRSRFGWLASFKRRVWEPCFFVFVLNGSCSRALHAIRQYDLTKNKRRRTRTYFDSLASMCSNSAISIWKVEPVGRGKTKTQTFLYTPKSILVNGPASRWNFYSHLFGLNKPVKQKRGKYFVSSIIKNIYLTCRVYQREP